MSACSCKPTKTAKYYLQLAIDNYEELNGATSQPTTHPRHPLQDPPSLHHQKQTTIFNKRILLLFQINSGRHKVVLNCGKIYYSIERWLWHACSVKPHTIGQIIQLSTADLQTLSRLFCASVEEQIITKGSVIGPSLCPTRGCPMNSSRCYQACSTQPSSQRQQPRRWLDSSSQTAESNSGNTEQGLVLSSAPFQIVP